MTMAQAGMILGNIILLLDKLKWILPFRFNTPIFLFACSKILCDHLFTDQ